MWILLAATCAAPAAAHEHGGGHSTADKMWAQMLANPRTLAVATTFDTHGRLWRARVVDGHLLVDHSDDQGSSFTGAVTVNPEQEAIAAEGDARPKIIAAANGDLYVSYTQLLPKPYAGNVRFSRSLDGGRSFSAPVTINDDREIIGHRFDALATGPGGKVYLAWLDKRDEAAAERRGEAYTGSALYYTVSEDRGAHFGANTKIVDHTCECCRVAMTVGADGVPALLWRQVYDGDVRDHAFVRLDGVSRPVRVSHDEWHIEACPHHGPALSSGPGETYHAVWFDGGPQHHGLFYARSLNGGRTFGAPLHIGDDEAQAGHADVLALGESVYLTWKAFDGEESAVYIMHSADGGATWAAPRRLAATADASDHPLLIGYRNRAYLSWNTLREGYRLFPLTGGTP